MASNEVASLESGHGQREFLYAVLNLPTSASAYEIRERYRSLSVLFHPDKQHDDRTRETAVKKFYEIQRAYEVLSDSFMRAVYDELGEDGLKLKLPPNLRNLPPGELKKVLKDIDEKVRIQVLESQVNSQGRLTCGFDLRRVFEPGWVEREWYYEVSERLREARISSFGVRHSLQKEINFKTKVTIAGFLNQGTTDEDDTSVGLSSQLSASQRIRGNVVGTLRYQYAPHLQFEGAMNILKRQMLQLSTTYEKDETTFKARASLSPTIFRLPSLVKDDNSSVLLPFPPLTLSLTRRLFPKSLLEGTLALNIPSLFLAPHMSDVSITMSKPIAISARQQLDNSARADYWSKAWVASGWSCGLSFRHPLIGGGPGLNVEYGIVIPSLSLNLRVGSQVSIIVGRIAQYIAGEWATNDGRTGVGAIASWGLAGVSLRLTLTHLGQSIVLPLMLSNESDLRMELLATVVPSTIYVLSSYFFLRPRINAKRLARRRAIQEENDEQISHKRREAEEASLLLREVAKRRMQAERERDGLVILEATYIPVDDDIWSTITGREEHLTELAVDVTIPVQALVQNGQLYIPGNRSKAHLQGFYDPLPDFPKRLWIRYEFHGRPHYTEVGDMWPVVLPLKDHLVRSNDKGI